MECQRLQHRREFGKIQDDFWFTVHQRILGEVSQDCAEI